ncbi:PIN domain-containing protein [Bythopirellula polymerisocia]|uniref:Toxin FitB n=1 Tax=Bythopirellula polymerisocia TaxID=2528003 RepID=A0A5C6CYR3_9BACT|nr:PIN domain-containing protein [Bythopirellula polymerisocia]TWU29710.1 Toxin FitB [Bythopirellula polymerisocia]
MKYLVDSNVLSESTKPDARPEVDRWLLHHDRDLVVNPIILGELQIGILQLPAGRRRKRLTDWFAAGISRLARVDFDAQTAGHWAQLVAELRRKGRAMPIKDSLIAASALQYGFTVATRNFADYRYAGVKLVNPFSED